MNKLDNANFAGKTAENVNSSRINWIFWYGYYFEKSFYEVIRNKRLNLERKLMRREKTFGSYPFFFRTSSIYILNLNSIVLQLYTQFLFILRKNQRKKNRNGIYYIYIFQSNVKKKTCYFYYYFFIFYLYIKYI